MTIQQFHGDLLGVTPSASQSAIYAARLRCVTDTAPESLTAAIVGLLWQLKQNPKINEGYLLVPSSNQDLVLKHLSELFRRCVRIRKTNMGAIQHVKDVFGRISLGSKLFSIDEPAVWMACGWGDTDTPTWFSGKF